ncbi:MAG: WD40 repeat domain-containing protein, partial [Planctomycetaceae bacterium]
YTSSEDGETRIWGFRQQQPVQPESDAAMVMQVLSPDSSLLATQDSDKNFRVFDAQSLQPVSPLFACSHPAHLVTFSADAATLALAGTALDGRGLVSLLNARTGALIGEEFSVAPLPLQQSFSPDGRWLAVIAGRKSGKSLWMYDLQAQACRQFENVEPDCLAWHPVAPHDLFIGNRDSRILRISLPDFTGRETGASGDTQVIRSLTFSPDGSVLATVTGDVVRVLQTDSLNSPNPTQIRHQQEPNGAVFFKDNRKLLTWGNDGVVQVWSRTSEQQPWQWQGQVRHEAAVNGASFNAAGSLFVSGSSDGKTIVWDTQSCVAAGPPLWHVLPATGVREVQQVRFSADDRSVLTSTSNSEGLLTILPEILLVLNLPQNSRAGYTTLQLLLNRSCMHVWKWSRERTFADPEEARTLAVHLSGTTIKGSTRFVRLGPGQQ